MLIPFVIAAVLAAGLGAMLLMTRSSASEARVQAGARESALEAERDGLQTKLAETERDLASSQSEVASAKANIDKGKTQIEKLNEEAAKSASEIRRLGGQIDEARQLSDDQTGRIENQSAEIAALVSEHNDLQARLEIVTRRADESEARNTGIVIGETDADTGTRPTALWDLEVTRSERTWRTSVATNPAADTSPFDTTDDPVRLAVEIEAAALRENVGSAITIDWRAAPVDDPARRLLIVRVAQEMLEVAARAPDPARLVATGETETTLKFVSVDDDEVLSMIPPHIVSDLIDVRDETGLSVTVKAE